MNVIKFNHVIRDLFERKNIQHNVLMNVYAMYHEDHRYYHTYEHLIRMYEDAIKLNILDDQLFLAIIFHDVIYNPKSKTNEEDSAKYFSEIYNGEDKSEIIQAILETKDHKTTTSLGV